MTSPNIERLRKLLLIALRSDQDGEIAGAMRAVRRVLAKSGHDAHWLVQTLRMDEATPWVMGPSVTDWQSMLEFCGEDMSLLMLSEREAEFVLSLHEKRSRRKNWQPTYRQQQWLEGIYNRLKITRRD